MSDEQNLHEFLERRAESAVPGEIAAQKRLSEAEADVEIRRWEQQHSEVALEKSHNQESHTRTLQEIEELRRICCEETDRVRQLRIEELSMQQERDPTTVSQLLSQIRALQNKANSLSEERDFHDREAPTALEHLTFLLNPWLFPVPEVPIAAILDCRLMRGIPRVLQETFFEGLPA